MLKNVRVTIKLGISTAFIFIVLITSVALVLFVNRTISEIIFNDIRTQIHDLVSIGSATIDGDLHKTIVSRDQENSDAYKALKSHLLDIRNHGTGVRFAYTMREGQDGSYVFVVDAEEEQGDLSHVNDLYTGNSPAMKEAFEKKDGVYIEKAFSTDDWGTWVSGFAPIYTSDGTFDGLVGVDVSAEHVMAYQKRTIVVVTLYSLVFIILIVYLSVKLSRRITDPLALLEREVDKIKNLDLSGDAHMYTYFKEINSMGNTIDTMKRALRSFRKFVPAELVTELVKSHEEATLCAERKNMTVMFSDIENFTTLAEHISPDDLVEILAGYFSGMSQIILANHGAVDKYIGDSVMAFWNAPRQMENHAYYACKAALECCEYLEAFNEKLEQQGHPRLNTRIGIHTGESIVGNIGYEQRLNYTVIGDNVNLASRVEGLNKYYRTNILITEGVLHELPDTVTVRKLDCAVVKGRGTGIWIYELLCLDGDAACPEAELARQYNEGMRNYYDRQWKSAVGRFEAVIAIRPEDVPARNMIARCKAFLENPPGEGWDGTHVFDAK